MWQCPKCGEQHDEQFKSCWKCAGESKPPAVNPIRCPRCLADLEFVGTKRFHEGADGGFIGGGELFVNRESFDVYVCPRCGRVEFFVDGIGEEFRPK
jgi:predicted nucleic-acid-binding Zn-ribbon protein